MSNASNRWHDIDMLLDRVLDGLHSKEDSRQLNEILRTDVEACRRYVAYMELHGRLTWGDGIRAGAEQRVEGRGTRDQRRGMAGSPAIGGEAGFGVRDSGFGIQSSGSLSVGAEVELPHQPESQTPSPEPPFPTLSTTNYPLPTAPFVGSWAFSYMVATVVMGVAILGFWAYKITHHQHIAEAPSKSAPSEAMQKMVFVGRITGMVDVKWSDDPRYLPPPGFAHVPLGRKYILDSGLLQITYDSGAKVILEGPCTYEVESTAGGYLALGKLTARIGARGEGRGAREEKGSRFKVQGSSSKPEPSSFILHPSSLFSVRTPTAIVTDLGTEFGVEVSDEGTTESHVFRGSVRVQVVGDGPNKDVVLRANESARVEKREDADDLHLIIGGEVGDPSKFVRRLVRPPRVIDLLDIVAGGDGMGWRRECGIDPTTGMEDPMYLSQQRVGDGQYRPVAYQRLIDGVFVPDGGSGSVQLDSAGHTFDGFPRTVGGTLFGIWARAADIDPKRQARERWHWVYSMGRGEQFMPQGRGMLCLHPNVGITFDLAAMRKLYEGVRPARFRATAGLADAALVLPEKDPHGIADLWVFVDGRLKLQRKGLRPKDGTIDVNIELGADDGFLTIAVTDNNCFASFDWTVFGDPVLEMTPTDTENK